MTLPWHESVLQRLLDLAAKDQLPNAIALTCPPGWGHEQLLAEAALLLIDASPDRQVDEFAHPDFRWVAPDGAVLKIDQIRRVNEFAVQTPQIAPRKVAAIADAHLLNANAANALLKTLEEPPPNTHLLLATPFWGKLLPTIRSRCQRFQVAVNDEQARLWLAEQGVEVTEQEYAEFGYAPLHVHTAQSHTQIDITTWLAALNPAALKTAVDQALELDVVLWLARWYRRLLLHLRGEKIPNCGASARAIIGFSDEIIQIRRQLESSNAANAKLLMEQLIVRWLQLQRRSAV